ncbi:MAG: hypothetical protein M1828_000840 [Chrysothrix sp. TS-e1954]|nr:MAG: hypothetical protein M1828_000840 [Chrysothrix sp. TS-e1954]
MDEQELQFHPSHTYPQHVQLDPSNHGQLTPPLDPENTESNGSKSPLQGFGGFFKSLSSSDKKVKADGQPPKRRGPKPDSKPAMTRRQELNRQAQRTHRERKEMYIKALEQEIYRLKELYQTTSRERDAYASENRKLRELLQQYGIPVPPPSSHTPATAGASGVGVGHPELGSSGSISGSYPPASSETHSRSPPIPNGTGPSPISASQGHGPGMGNLTAMLPGAGGIDYATVGVDFVTTYDGRAAPYPSPPPHQ